MAISWKQTVALSERELDPDGEAYPCKFMFKILTWLHSLQCRGRRRKCKRLLFLLIMQSES
jgi:hypothetical protein